MSFGYRQLLVTYLGPQWPRVLLLALLLALTIGLELLNPQIIRQFIDGAAAGAPLETLARTALLFLGAALLLQLGQLAEVYVAQNVGLTATNHLRADLTLHVLRLDPPFHARHTAGELIERTDGDVGTLGNFFARMVVYLFGNLILLLGVLVLLTRVDWRIGAAVGVFAAAGVALTLAIRRLAVPRFAALRQASAELFGLVEERLAGTEDVRANGAGPYVISRFLERSRALLWADIRSRLAGTATFNTPRFFLNVATVAALAIAAYLYRRGELTIGTVYLVFAYCEAVRRPLESIARQLQDLQQAAASIGRVRGLLAERSIVVDGPGAPQPPGPLSLELEHVSFGYADGAVAQRQALRDVSLRLEAGQVLGLLGRTGSGKTTLARLLFRLYDPDAGVIRLGGTDLRQPTLEGLRARIGVVTQEVQLFAGSVRDNVTLFDPDIPDTLIHETLDALGLRDHLLSLPEGLDSPMPGLSAGQAQLLAFARVFLRDPGLVVLDEASSRLDPETERLLERAVDRLLEGRTAIVIAHRLATVQRADRILILEDGEIAEEGPRAALVADPGSRFSQLLRAGLEEVLV